MFDLGGVVMDIRRENAVDALKKIGVTDADEMLGLYGQKGIFLALERGEVTPSEFRAEVRKSIDPKVAGHEVSDREIDSAFVKFLIGIPVERLHQLVELRRDYHVYMLSNTNPIMWYEFILDEFKKDGGTVLDYFDDLLASFDVRAYKPEADIFHKAAEKFRILPEETVFFDDSLSNVEAARSLGFKGVHVDDLSKSYREMLSDAK